VISLLADANIQGQVEILVARMQADYWRGYWDYLQLRHVTFAVRHSNTSYAAALGYRTLIVRPRHGCTSLACVLHLDKCAGRSRPRIQAPISHRSVSLVRSIRTEFRERRPQHLRRFPLRTYPKTPAAEYVMKAHANWSIAA
jgi:hypothetical protein